MPSIATQLEQVRKRIDKACESAGRDPRSVTLLAVSKTFGPEAVIEAVQAGQRAFGENYVQEGVEKIAALARWAAEQPAPPALQWHCIGPLQSNKSRPVAEHFDWVHSVDRLKIAQRLSEQRPPELAPLQVCLQVNIDGGTNKSGVAPAEALALALQVQELPRLVLRGLMTVPEPSEDAAQTLAVHQQARALFDRLNASGRLHRPLDTLSMGMSADLEPAVAAGSTMVRVGTAIFGGRIRA
ncbi:MAG: YggS family pyridoxal phosphate-dependent enzyme [Betaproteobacteria bacterium]